VPQDAIALLPNAPTIYEVPLTLEDTGIADVISQRLSLKVTKPHLKDWRKVVERATNGLEKTVTIGVVAKYMDNTDTYMSVFEALRAAAWTHDAKLKIKWIDAEGLDKSSANLKDVFSG